MCGLISILAPLFGGTDKSTQTCHNSRSPCRNLYSGPSEYEAAILLIRSIWEKSENGAETERDESSWR